MFGYIRTLAGFGNGNKLVCMDGYFWIRIKKIAYAAVFTGSCSSGSLGFIKGTICDVEECGFGSMVSFALHRVHGFI